MHEAKAMLPGTLNSFAISMVIQLMTTMLTISFSTTYRLGLLQIFNQFGHYVCNSFLSVPTSRCFFISQTPLRCCHMSEENNLILVWIGCLQKALHSLTMVPHFRICVYNYPSSSYMLLRHLKFFKCSYICTSTRY